MSSSHKIFNSCGSKLVRGKVRKVRFCALMSLLAVYLVLTFMDITMRDVIRTIGLSTSYSKPTLGSNTFHLSRHLLFVQSETQIKATQAPNVQNHLLSTHSISTNNILGEGTLQNQTTPPNKIVSSHNSTTFDFSTSKLPTAIPLANLLQLNKTLNLRPNFTKQTTSEASQVPSKKTLNQLHSILKPLNHNDTSLINRISDLFKIQSIENTTCSPRAIENFPRDLFTNAQRRKGWAIIHCLVTIYMFIGLAIVCDDYFVASLESICERWNIQADVAGATFMAAGSSAPELATTIIGVFIAEDDIGLGAVVGSADFNIMFVIAVTAFAAKCVIYLNWWPLARDSFYYVLCIIMLAVIINDGYVYWYEAFVMLIAYVLYCVFMYFNRSVEAWIKTRFSSSSATSRWYYCCHESHLYGNSENAGNYAALDQVTDGKSPLLENGNAVKMETLSINKNRNSTDYHTDDDDDTEDILHSSHRYDALKEGLNSNAANSDHNSVMSYPVEASCWEKFYWFLGVPLKLCFFLSIPDCRSKRWQLCYSVTFIMSCVWISLLSYVMIWMITVVGYTLDIPDSVMGLTAVAFGSSIPDAVASVLVVRNGEGDMAISNAVGSNIFDILLCMGLPWFLKTLISGLPVVVFSKGLLYAVLTLILNVLALVVTTHCTGWKLTKPYGCILMFFYFAFLAVCVLYEYNIFGMMHPLECTLNLE